MADINKLKNRARREEQRENWAAAIEFYTRALRASERNRDSAADFSLYNRIGDIHLRLGDVESAVASYERAVARYAEHDLHTSAIAVCNKVLRIQPSRIATYLQLAQLQLATGLVAEARVNYLRYATELLTRGENDRAYGSLEEYVERSGDLGSAFRFAGALVANGRSEEALVLLLRLREQAEASGGDVQAFRKPIEAIRGFKGRPASRAGAEAAQLAGADSEGGLAKAAVVPDVPPVQEEEGREAPEGIAILEAELDAAVGLDAAVREEGPPAEPALVEGTGGPAAEPVTEPGEAEGLAEAAAEAADSERAETADSERAEAAPAAVDLDQVDGPAVRGRSEGRRIAAELPEGPSEFAERPWELVQGPSEFAEGPTELAAHAEPGGAGDGGAEAVELDREGRRPAVWTGVPPEEAEVAEPDVDDRRAPAGVSPEDPEETWDPFPPVPDAARVRAMPDLGEAASPDREPAEEEPPEPEAAEGPLLEPARRVPAVRTGRIAPDREPAEEELPAAFAYRPRFLVEDEAEEPTPPAVLRGEAVAFPTEGEPLSVPEPPALRPLESEAPEPRGYLAPERAESEPSVEMAVEAGPKGAAPPAAREPVEGGAAWPLDVGVPEERSAEPPEDGAEKDAAGLWEGTEPREVDASYLEHFERGLSLKEAGDLEGAIREFERATESPACFLPAFRKLRECLELRESTASAAEAGERPEEAEEVEGLEDELPPVSTPSAEAVPEAAGSVSSPSPDATAGFADGGEVTEPAEQGTAEVGFRQWLERASPEVLPRALEELERRGENRKALRVVERMIQMEPGKASLHRRRIAYCTELGQDDVLPEAYLSLAAALEDAGEREGARAAFERAAELEPANEAALDGLARLGTRLRERTKFPLAPAGTPLGDDDPEAKARGTELSEEWAEETAEPWEEDVGGVLRFPATTAPAAAGGTPSTLKPARAEEEWDGPIPYDHRAAGRERVVDFDVILAELKEQLAGGVADQADGSSRTEVGERLKDMGLLDDAIRELQAAVRRPDAPPRAFELLGEAFIEKGQARVATRLLAEALQRLSGSAPEEELLGVLYQLGVAYQEVGDRARALECYERIFSVNIDYRDVRDRIESCAA